MTLRRSFALAAGGICTIALFACEPADLATPADTVSPAMNFTNGPPSPGPFIVRIAGAGSRVITTDLEDGLLAIHGQVTGLTECTNASTRVQVDIQIVRTPSDAQAINLLLKGRDNQVSIYNGTDVSDLSPFDADRFCAFIANNTPVYQGLVKYRLSQNGQGNLLFFWEGFVTATDGGAESHYVERQYGKVQPDGSVEFIIEDIRIQN